MSSPRPIPQAPFPDVRSAFLLTIAAIFAGGLVGFLFIDLGPLFAEGIGTAIGIGGVATLAARRVADPQAARIGLEGLAWRHWPLILCLAPAVLIASELDNFAYDWSPATETTSAADSESTSESHSEKAGANVDASAEKAASAGAEVDAEVEVKADVEADVEAATSGETTAPTTEELALPGAAPDSSAEEEEPARLIDPDDPFSLMEGLIVAVGIAPVVHEFLFRGVLQQGLVAQLGVARGVTLTALLWTMLRPVPSASPARFAAAFIAWFAMGWLLGIVRISTGSILGSVLLASLWAAVGFASLALEGRVELPGLNVEGTHLPVAVTVASVLLVAWAARRVYEDVRRAHPT